MSTSNTVVSKVKGQGSPVVSKVDLESKLRKQIEERQKKTLDKQVKYGMRNLEYTQRIGLLSGVVQGYLDTVQSCIDTDRTEELPMDSGVPVVIQEMNKYVTWILDNIRFVETGKLTEYKREGLRQPDIDKDLPPFVLPTLRGDKEKN